MRIQDLLSEGKQEPKPRAEVNDVFIEGKGWTNFRLFCNTADQVMFTNNDLFRLYRKFEELNVKMVNIDYTNNMGRKVSADYGMNEFDAVCKPSDKPERFKK